MSQLNVFDIDNDNNLKKIIWNKEDIWKIYSKVLPKNKTPNFSVYTK